MVYHIGDKLRFNWTDSVNMNGIAKPHCQRRCAVPILALLLIAGGPATAMRFGAIDRFRLVNQAVPVLEWNEIDFEARPSLGPGEKFAILSVRLATGRSIGKYDYDLAGTTCLAMAIDDGPFRPETWEQRQAADVEVVHLLYKVKQTDSPFSLNIALLDTNETVTLNSNGTVEGDDAGAADTAEALLDTQPAPVEAPAAAVEEKPDEPKPEPDQAVLPAVEKPKPKPILIEEEVEDDW